MLFVNFYELKILFMSMKQENIEHQEEPQIDYSHWKDWYLGIQSIFYFAQGAAFTGVILIPVFLQNQLGLTAEDAIGAQSMIMIPWYIKIIFGLTSDNYPIGRFGRRKPYILIAGIMGVVGWFVFGNLSKYSSAVIITGILMTGSVAVADTVFDSLGVDIVPPHRRGHLQGFGWGFRGLGGALSGYLLGVIISDLGWSRAYMILGGLMTLGCFATLLVYEPKTIAGREIDKISFADLKNEFKKPNTWLISLFNILGGIGIGIIMVISTYLNDEFGVEIEGLGLGVSYFAIGQFAGALVIGYLGQKFPLKIVLTSTVLAYVGLIAGLLGLDFTSQDRLFAVIGILGAINGGFEATQMRISMEFSVGPLSGTMYGWYNSMSNLAQTGIGAVIIAQVAVATGSYPIGMQISSIFLLLTLIPGFKAIKKIPVELQKS